MVISTERYDPFVFIVRLLRARRVIALTFAALFFLMTAYLPMAMGLSRFANTLRNEPIMWLLVAIFVVPVAFFLWLAFPPRSALAKLEVRHDSIRFVPAPFMRRLLGEPILEAFISPQAKEIVLSRDLRDKAPNTWSVSILSTGEPERSFKTTRLNLTTAQEGHKIVEGIGAATGLPVRMITRQQTMSGTVEETPWTPPTSQGKMVGVGLAIGAMPYLGGAIAGYVFPGLAVILAVGFALWLFDLLAISAFARRSQQRTQNLGAHLVARFFLFWTGYGFAFVIVAYVLRGN